MSCCRPKHVPEGAGRWFSRQKGMLAVYEEHVEKEKLLCVSWDRENGSNAGSKMYAIFESPAKYFEAVGGMPVGTVCGYEMILEGYRCKLYLDVEWETPERADAEDSGIIQAICEAIVVNAKAMLQRVLSPPCTPSQKTKNREEWQDLEHGIYVSTCSRMKGSMFKNSFHLVAHNIIFPNNHDGMMKEFVARLGFSDYIDGSVYTRNRCIRTELSAKLGEKACFQNLQRHSERERPSELVRSLITHFDPGLASVCFKHQESWLVPTKDSVVAKRTSLIISEAASKKAKPNSVDPSNFLGNYFKHIFVDEASTQITIRPIGEKDALPPVVRELLHRKIVQPADVSFVYIENAKWCISKLMQAVKHHHHSNNACAIAVKVDNRVDIYARCYGCKASEYAALTTFGKNRLLPSLATNDAFRRIVHSPYGIDRVTDSMDRKRVALLFQQTQGAITQMLDNSDSKTNFTKSLCYLWIKYVKSASRGWFFVSEPCHPPVPSLPLT